MFNPYQSSAYSPYLQPQTVTQVSGIDSARQIRLPPNSSMFALDYDQKHVYAVYTDGAGVVSAVPYELTPCRQEGRYATVEQFNELGRQATELMRQFGIKRPSADGRERKRRGKEEPWTETCP